MSKYLNVVYKASKFLNMFYPSSLTNRSPGLDLELLDSLESHIRSVAEVGHIYIPFLSASILHLQGPPNTGLLRLHSQAPPFSHSLAHAGAYGQCVFLAKQGIP